MNSNNTTEGILRTALSAYVDAKKPLKKTGTSDTESPSARVRKLTPPTKVYTVKPNPLDSDEFAKGLEKLKNKAYEADMTSEDMKDALKKAIIAYRLARNPLGPGETQKRKEKVDALVLNKPAQKNPSLAEQKQRATSQHNATYSKSQHRTNMIKLTDIVEELLQDKLNERLAEMETEDVLRLVGETTQVDTDESSESTQTN